MSDKAMQQLYVIKYIHMTASNRQEDLGLDPRYWDTTIEFHLGRGREAEEMAGSDYSYSFLCFSYKKVKTLLIVIYC